MDSEEVRMMAKRRAIQTGDSHDWDEMEKLHELRLQLSERLNAQNARVSVYLICLAPKFDFTRSMNVAVYLSSALGRQIDHQTLGTTFLLYEFDNINYPCYTLHTFRTTQ